MRKSVIRKEIKAANIKAGESLDRLMVRECRKILTDDQWQAVITIAKRANQGAAL